MPPTGTCPTCGRENLRLTPAGRLAPHRTIDDNGTLGYLCPNSRPKTGDPR